MKERLNNWLDKPVTVRGYLKTCGWSLAISVIIYTIIACYIYIDEIKDFFEEVTSKIKARLGFDKTNSEDSSEFDV